VRRPGAKNLLRPVCSFVAIRSSPVQPGSRFFQALPISRRRAAAMSSHVMEESPRTGTVGLRTPSDRPRTSGHPPVFFWQTRQPSRQQVVSGSMRSRAAGAGECPPLSLIAADNAQIVPIHDLCLTDVPLRLAKLPAFRPSITLRDGCR